MKGKKHKVLRQLKATLALGALALGVGAVTEVATDFIAPQEAHAMTWVDNNTKAFDWLPHFQEGQTKLSSVTGAKLLQKNVYNDGHYFNVYTAPSTMTATYTNVGMFNGQVVNMKFKLYNKKGTFDQVRWATSTLGFANESIYSGRMKHYDTEVWFETQAGAKINFGDAVIGLAFMDLEPNYLYSWGARQKSLNQHVVIDTNSANVQFATNYNKTTLIDKARVRSQNTLITKDDVTIPDNFYTGYGNILGTLTDTSAIVGYKQKSGSNLKFTFKGDYAYRDLLLMNGVTVTKNVDQPKPVKEQSPDNKTFTKNQIELKDKNLTYKITQTIKQDYGKNGKGFTITDSLPAGFDVSSISVSNSGMWSTTNSNGKITFKATKDVYKAPANYTFTIKGTVKDSVTKLTNKAVSVPPGVAAKNSNIVVATVPKPVTQIAPVKEQSPDNKTFTKNQIELKDKNLTYKITQTIKQDNFKNGKGFTITDNLPSGFDVSSISVSNSGMWSTTNSNGKVTFKATKDVYKAPANYTFTIKGTVKDTANRFENKAVAAPPGVTSMNSNTVVATVPKPVNQPKPVKEQDVGGGFTKNESTMNRETVTYRITQTIAKDDFNNGTGFTIADDLPAGFVYTSNSMSDSTHWSTSVTNGKVTIKATKDVYKAPGNYTFTINGKVTDLTTTKLSNKAVSTTPKGQAETSNTVVANIPIVNKTIYYKDFDGYVENLQTPKVIKLRPWQSHTETLPKSITHETKVYNYVKASNDGTEVTPANLVIKGSDATNVYNNYYRTKWKYTVLHQKNGTTPAPTASAQEESKQNSDLLRREIKEVYLKTNDGKSIAKYNISGVPFTGKYNNEPTWYPADTGQTFDKARNDTQVIRLNYKQYTLASAVDYIKLDTTQADTRKIPFEAKVTFTGLPEAPLLNTTGLTGTRLKDAETTNNLYNAYLALLTYNVKVDNVTTGSTGVYTKKDKPYYKEGSLLKLRKTATFKGYLEDTKLKKNTVNTIKFNLKLSEDNITPGKPNTDILFGKKDIATNTHINTASEKTLTNADLKNNALVYSNPVRTLYVGSTKKIHTYYETLKIGFKENGRTKAGYYDEVEIPVSFRTDVKNLAGDSPVFSLAAPKSILDLYKDESKEVQGYNEAYLDFKDGYTSTEAAGKKKVDTASRTSIPSIVPTWSGSTETLTTKYTPTRIEARTGTVVNDKQLQSSGLDKLKASSWVKGQNRFYLPIWLKPGKYNVTMDNTLLGKDKQAVGANKINYKLVREINVVAQMYSDESSKTKKLDELYVQPVFADKDYSKLSDLTSNGRKWITSISTQNGTNN